MRGFFLTAIASLTFVLGIPGVALSQQQAETLRIVEPTPGMAERGKVFEIVVEGPPGADVSIVVDEREPVRVRLGPDGSKRVGPVAFADGAGSVSIEAFTVGREPGLGAKVVAYRRPNWISRSGPAPRFKRTLSSRIVPGLVVAAVPLASMGASYYLLGRAGSDAAFDVLLGGVGLSATFVPVLLAAVWPKTGSSGAAEPWAILVGSGLTSLAGVFFAHRLQQDGDTVGACFTLFATTFAAGTAGILAGEFSARWGQTGPALHMKWRY